MTTETQNRQEQNEARVGSTHLEPDTSVQVGHAVQEAAQEHLTRAIGSVLDGVGDQMVETIRRHPVPSFELTMNRQPPQDVRTALSNTWRSLLLFALANGRRQSDRALRSMLGASLTAAFSDALRSQIEEASKERMRRLASESVQALPEGARNKNVQRRLDRRLDAALEEMLDTLFADALREEVRAEGEAAIHALVGGNLLSAREGGERAVQSLLARTVACVEDHWIQTVPELLKVALESADAGTASAEKTTESPARDEAESAEMPQTILHSDQRAQTIWKKAHDKATRQGRENGQARRAAFDALKEAYEKKGDRWVRKEDSAPDDGTRKAESGRGRQPDDGATKGSSPSNGSSRSSRRSTS